ncbi:MAG: hypothetical protein NTU44_11430 [Bacteroidetes bacterium]|nr:hypothetical protein [Bacteroidota bacterium]
MHEVFIRPNKTDTLGQRKNTPKEFKLGNPGGLVAASRRRLALPSFVGIPIRYRSSGPHQPRSGSGYWKENLYKNLFLFFARAVWFTTLLPDRRGQTVFLIKTGRD